MSGLENLTVLLVEDSPQLRALLVSVLSQLGIGNIIRANDGADAIRQIKSMQTDPGSIGATSIDLILSDWLMEPIDGATLLRWVRRHKESPDRFMPFIMVSAYSDWDRVQTARNLGVNEFLAKPFSVASVFEHISAVIQDTRSFVRTDSFFGPDRRRSRKYVADEKRVIHPSGKDSMEKRIRFYNVPRALRRKVGSDFQANIATIVKIQKELDEWNDDFMKWTNEYIGQINRRIAAAAAKDAGSRRADFSEINRISHELRGQGGIFGYPLVSAVAKSLFELTKDTLDRSDECLQLIKDHVGTLRAVLRDEVRGDGGQVGIEIIKALRQANAKFLKEQGNLALVSRDFLKSNR
jgi:CheY-like chemotaxis protein